MEPPNRGGKRARKRWMTLKRKAKKREGGREK
jgi:hypothetical protein